MKHLSLTVRSIGRATLSIVAILALAWPALAQPTDWKADWDATVAAANHEGALILSVPSGRAWRDALAEFEQAYPAIKLDMTPMASRDFWPRIVKEHGADQYLWDLRIGGVDAPSYDLKNKGELAPVRPLLVLPEITDDKVWAAGFDGLFLDKEKKFFPAFVAYESQSVYYNKTKIANPASLTIQSLNDPAWMGKISMADPRGGAALNTLTVINKLYGDEVIKTLINVQKPVITNQPRQQMDWLASGRYPIAFGMPSITLVEYAQRGVPIDDFVKVPGLHIWSPGVGALQYPIKAPHPNATKVFVNWLLSRDEQAKLMRAVQLDSQRIDVPPGDPATVVDAKLMSQYICTQAEDLQPYEQHVVAILRASLP